MKTILFARHGKSDWDAAFDEDAERPLAGRGKKAARWMGDFLARAGEAPDLVLTSPAVRATQTAALAAGAGEWDVYIQAVPALYESSPADLLGAIRSAGADVSCLMVVGHEPTWSLAAGQMIGRAALRMPTASVARVDVDVSQWAEVDFGKGELIWLITPRLLQSGCA